MMQPEEIADGVPFFAGDEYSSITGALIDAAGPTILLFK
jgi:hypothetical protein